MFTKKSVFWLAALTLVGFGGLGLIIMFFTEKTELKTVLAGAEPWHLQVLAGVFYGWAAARLGWVIVEQPLLKTTKIFFVNLIQPLELDWWGIIFISFCAGVGEELLFRGALQPLLGLWLTAIIFVAMHGYLNPWNWRISIYGLFMTLAIAGIGYLSRHLGLVSAMMAHTVIDIYLLWRLSTSRAQNA